MKRLLTLASLLCLFAFCLPATGIGQTKTPVKYGKYSCTASHYSHGSYEFIPRGSFTLYKNGTYAYNGFAKPSVGKFTVDAQGSILFSGGYLDHGKAEKIDRPNKYFLVFPTNPDNRWTSTWQSP